MTPFADRPLADLTAGLPGRTVGDADVRVTGVTYRSDQVEPGDLFFCVPGTRVDGHEFAPEAAAAGAVAVVAERELALPGHVAQVVVPSVREAMGPVSAAFYGRPADRMTVVGITGTNGKTTTTYLLESVFRAAGLAPGVVGTTGVRIDGQPEPFPRTTPEAPDLHRLLVRMLEHGVRAVAMEVSSHGLHQHRVGGFRFACAVFTNLTQDHLDYHDTMEEYFRAKAMLFTPEIAERAAVNLDSPEGRRLVDTGVPTVTYGVAEGADVRGEDVHTDASGLAFRVGTLEVRSRLRGLFNVSNCLAALAAARSVGIEDAATAEGIGVLAGVPGRLEPVEAGQDFLVLVDYAHTPDSLENVLRAARPLAKGRVIVAFGCGGDRDRGKRPLMGEVATTLADLTVVTSDNPRSEDPLAIVAEIERGARRGRGRYVVEPDRREAIRMALGEAEAGDVVVIAGKGHETGQEFAGGMVVPFDDRIVAAEELRRLR
ncbi:MAG: UDP-N-acetylmuramoyl-L-alanyl-D-glutamate--2,6-diaminopimelate ligase [Actinomycetota bacterium]|nr:UDP-N-acetylmuramoyl-L-alanyl-D-glutamate--2,6-diaminopimelate ligase [Actinomycetota bacterium]